MTVAGMLLIVAGGVLIWSGVTGRSVFDLLSFEGADTDEEGDDTDG